MLAADSITVCRSSITEVCSLLSMDKRFHPILLRRLGGRTRLRNLTVFLICPRLTPWVFPVWSSVAALNYTISMKNFDALSEQEILALAISLEEEHERVYADFAEGLRQDFPASATVFQGMREEESGHRRRLIELYRQKFGEHIPLVRPQDVRGFVQQKPVWLVRPLRLHTGPKPASAMEVETRRFYEKAAARTQDAGIRQLLDDLAQEERAHEDRAQELKTDELSPDVAQDEERARRRLLVLQIVQPGLAGIIDGSISTLAPVFAAAFATRTPRDAFLVGMAASIGAGISMGFTEALSDDGSL